MYGCNKELFGYINEHNSSEIAHIQSLNSKKVRYNPNLTEEELNDYENLIVLCNNHHTEIDAIENKNKYTVEYLKEMKKNHEQMISYKLRFNMQPLQQIIYEPIPELLDIYWQESLYKLDEISDSDVEKAINMIFNQDQLTRFILYNIILNSNFNDNDINMKCALNLISNLADEDKAQQIMILERLGFIEEDRFTGEFDENHLFSNEDGSTTYYGNNIYIKFIYGSWQFTEYGRIIFSFYIYYKKDYERFFNFLINKSI